MQWNQLTNLLVSSLSVAGIAFAILFLYSDYRLDLYRQELFHLRDQLFNAALNAGVGFDHPAYRHLNLRINSLIRYAHKTNLKTLILLTVADLLRLGLAKPPKKSMRSLSKALGGLSRFQQFTLINLHNDLVNLVFKRVFFFQVKTDFSADLLPGLPRNAKESVAWAVENQAIETYRIERLHSC
jgi:hypothetical protein